MHINGSHLQEHNVNQQRVKTLTSNRTFAFSLACAHPLSVSSLTSRIRPRQHHRWLDVALWRSCRHGRITTKLVSSLHGQKQGDTDWTDSIDQTSSLRLARRPDRRLRDHLQISDSRPSPTTPQTTAQPARQELASLGRTVVVERTLSSRMDRQKSVKKGLVSSSSGQIGSWCYARSNWTFSNRAHRQRRR